MISRIVAAYRMLDGFRRLLVNMLFLVTLLLVAALYFYGSASGRIESGTVLHIALQGNVTDSLPEEPAPMLQVVMGEPLAMDTRLSDVTEALDRAALDDRIAGVILDVSEMTGVGMAGLREIGAAVDRYREKTGKQVWSWSSSYSQSQYLIAAHADYVGLHPMGDVVLKGLSSTTLYWGALFRTLGIEVDVHKAGAFKNAPEVFTFDRPSTESLAAQKSYMDDAWNGLVKRLEGRRGMRVGAIDHLMKQLMETPSTGPSWAQQFLDAGFVDALETREDFRKKLGTQYADGQFSSMKWVDFGTYLQVSPRSEDASTGIGIVVAEGEISSMPELGGVTPEGMSALIDEVQADPSIRALVVRVNSPGGDAMAAESIRARLEKYKRETQNPIIISLGDVAASGGYWIATAGDQIIADPFSITGSIGVFAMSVRAEGLRKELEVGRGGYQTTPLANLGNPVAEPSEVERRMIEGSVNRTYAEFKRLVSQSRKMPIDEVEQVAQGRVWTGNQAVRYGLADRLGGLNDAVDVARQTARLPSDTAVIRYEPQTSAWGGLVRSMMQSQAGVELSRWVEGSATLRAMTQKQGHAMAWAPFEPTL